MRNIDLSLELKKYECAVYFDTSTWQDTDLFSYLLKYYNRFEDLNLVFSKLSYRCRRVKDLSKFYIVIFKNPIFA